MVVSPLYLERFGMPESVHDLNPTYCLRYENYPLWQFIENGHQIKFRPAGCIVCNNGYALVQMAKTGLGIINIPKFLIKDELENGELIPILTHLVQEKFDISLLYPHRRHLSPKVKVAIEFFTDLMCRQQAFL